MYCVIEMSLLLSLYLGVTVHLSPRVHSAQVTRSIRELTWTERQLLRA